MAHVGLNSSSVHRAGMFLTIILGGEGFQDFGGSAILSCTILFSNMPYYLVPCSNIPYPVNVVFWAPNQIKGRKEKDLEPTLSLQRKAQ